MDTPAVTQARYLASVGPGGAFLPPVMPEVAFAGRSNVGKSSLINRLSGRRQLAKVSSTPGKTRTINFFEIECADSLMFHLVDLPGYGYAKRSKGERMSWGPLLESYLLGRVTLRVVVLLVDVRRGLEDEERDLIDLLSRPSRVSRPPVATLVVATKTDKLPLAKRKVTLAALAPKGIPVIGVSSETGDGFDRLWHRLRATMGFLTPPEPSSDDAGEAGVRAESKGEPPVEGDQANRPT